MLVLYVGVLHGVIKKMFYERSKWRFCYDVFGAKIKNGVNIFRFFFPPIIIRDTIETGLDYFLWRAKGREH